MHETGLGRDYLLVAGADTPYLCPDPAGFLKTVSPQVFPDVILFWPYQQPRVSMPTAVLVIYFKSNLIEIDTFFSSQQIY